jgi:ketosteroid isomerase-like protein
MKIPRLLSLVLLLAAVSTPAHTQTQAQPGASGDALFQTIRSLDTQLFDAYNHCDLATIGSLVSEDLEFYHDKTGLARGRQALVDAIRKNICDKVTHQLVPGTLEVYPIADYGAVEIGVHRFHHPGHEDPNSVGEAKFIQLWQNKDGVWRLTRVISFDHQSVHE